MIETIKLDSSFHIEVDMYGNDSSCEVHFFGPGFYSSDEYVRVDVDKAKEIIVALTKFVEEKERK